MKKEITIEKNDSGQRLDRFLMKLFPALKSGIIYKALRNKDIKLDGKRTEASIRLSEGDKVYVYFPDSLLEKRDVGDDFMKAKDSLSILYEDENIILLDKEQGLTVHADKDNAFDTLIDRIKKYLFLKGEYDPENEQSFTPALCNRIDRNTCGIVIAAKNAEALRILCEKIKNREITKKYLCILVGKPSKPEDMLTAFLQKDSLKNKVEICAHKAPQNLTIKTRYKLLDSFEELSLAEIDLLTGRTHQIRAHMSYIGCPLLGDGKYGINRINEKYGFKMQALCSYRLIFSFKTDGGILNYLAEKSFETKQVPFLKKYYELKRKNIK